MGSERGERSDENVAASSAANAVARRHHPPPAARRRKRCEKHPIVLFVRVEPKFKFALARSHDLKRLEKPPMHYYLLLRVQACLLIGVVKHFGISLARLIIDDAEVKQDISLFMGNSRAFWNAEVEAA
jgi:hypothetical protein